MDIFRLISFKFKYNKLRKAILIIFCISLGLLVYNLSLQINIIGRVEHKLSFLRNSRNLSDYIYPDSKTSLIEVERSFYCKVETDVLIIYFISSSPANRKRRKAIRETWGKHIRPRPIFMIGITDDKIDMELVLNESNDHKDIVVENFVDSYFNLTIKTAFMFKHFGKICPNAKYFMKTDDDIFINTDLVNSILNAQRTSEPMLLGYRKKAYKPLRNSDSKWYLPRWLYPQKLFPPYLLGAGYIISKNAIPVIYHASLFTPMVHIEDLMFTGIVAVQELGLYLTHDKRFYPYTPFLTNYCLLSDFVTTHGMIPSDLYKLWQGKTKSCNDTSNAFIYKLFSLKEMK